MLVEYLEGKEAIYKVRPNWDAVYDADPEAHYFLSWPWLFAERAPLGRNAFVLAARPDGDDTDYVAFLPLRIRTRERANAGFHNEINCAGNYTSDYTGFICRPGFEEQAIPALAARVRQMNWMRLRLEYFSASERRSELFLSGFSKNTFQTTEMNLVNPDGTNNSICPFTMLAETWDKYLETRVSSNTRQKIRRFLRQVESSDAYRITHTTAETLDRDIDLLLSLWTVKWGARKGRRLQTILNANRGMLRHAFATGTLFMPVLWHGEQAVCMLGILVDDRKKTYNFYIGGRDEAFKGPPTGLVMHAYAIRHAIGQGILKYDFLRGNEPYKYSFGGEEKHIKSLILSTRDRQNLGGKLDAGSVPLVLQRSIELHQADKHAEAERGYRQVLDVDPHHAKALYLLGQVAARRGDHATAVKQFRALVALKPGMIKAWYRLGRSLRAREEWAEAAEAYGEVLKRQRTLPNVWSDLGQALSRLDQFDHALAAFEAALALKADYADAQTGRTEAQQARGRLTDQEAARRAARHAAVGTRIAKLLTIPAAAEEPGVAPAPASASAAIRPVIERTADAILPAQLWRPTASALHTVLAASGPRQRIKPLIRTPSR